MAQGVRWRSADLDFLPNDGKRYEVIDGELYVSKAPGIEHQKILTDISLELGNWNRGTNLGWVLVGPGLIFSDDDDVIPDLIWISYPRLEIAREADHKLHSAPELVLEVLSPGSSNQRRDRDVKVKLYSRRGVQEYWIADWQQRCIEVYRRSDAALHLVATLTEDDALESPLLPGFRLPLRPLFAGLAPFDS